MNYNYYLAGPVVTDEAKKTIKDVLLSSYIETVSSNESESQ